MTDISRPAIQRPPDWHDLLTADEWAAAVNTLGEHRLIELRPLMTQVSPRFRSTFVGHLPTFAAYPPGQATMLALALSTDAARRTACVGGPTCGCHGGSREEGR
jgi:hypothetical protein